MKRSHLPLHSLRAFESSARHASFSKAAEELGVTHSAVSQQIKRLEELLGADLFLRSNRGVALTGSGELLLPILADAFDQIAQTLDRLVDGTGENSLSVTTTPSFAAKWLMPRLRRWRTGHESLSIHLRPSLRFLDLANGEGDIGIRCGTPPWKGLKAELLLPIHMTPMCSPSLLDDGGTPHSIGELLGFPLLHADITGHELGEEWRTWLTAAGLSEHPSLEGPSFHDPNLALQAAIDGLGIAMGYLELAEHDIATGRLVRPFDHVVQHAFSYYLVYPRRRAQLAKIKAFRDWILAECCRA